MRPFALPDIGEGLDEAEIVRWLVEVGDEVRRDQPLVEVETDKAVAELPAPVAGRIARIVVAVGARVAVGTVLVEIDDGAEVTAPAPSTATTTVRTTTAAMTTVVEPPSDRDRRGRVLASPATRKLAVEMGIDLGDIAGTGPGGRVSSDDVRAKVRPRTPSAPARLPAADRGPASHPGALGWAEPGPLALRGIRRATALAMDRAWREIPHLTLLDEIDATELMAVRRSVQAELDSKITLTAFFVAAVAIALRRYPLVNASIDLSTETIMVQQRCNIGIATATDDGLLVPVLFDADRKSVRELSDEIASLTARARARQCRLEELRGGTFTVTNYGSLGGRYGTPIIRPPEAAIMGFGAIRTRPYVVGDTVAARPTLPIVMSADHRLVDGDLATAFSERVIELLTEPARLLVGP